MSDRVRELEELVSKMCAATKHMADASESDPVLYNSLSLLCFVHRELARVYQVEVHTPAFTERDTHGPQAEDLRTAAPLDKS